MEKHYVVNFKAHLTKFVLAFKAQSHIDIYWKKGQKIAQSSKVPLINTIANFDQSLQIHCNMMFDTSAKLFKEKYTKFQIVLHTEKGDKKVGQIKFDVSKYLNQRNKTAKEYELALQKCPDKNAKLILKLSAQILKQISPDNKSNSSDNTVSIETLINKGPLLDMSKSNILIGNSGSSSQISINSSNSKASNIQKQSNQSSRSSSSSTNIPTKDVPVSSKEIKKQPSKDNSSISTNQQILTSKDDLTSNLQAQNKRIRQKLKKKAALLKQNEELKQKIKNQQYESVKQLKSKIDNGRKQFQKLQVTIKKHVLLQKQVLAMQDEIFRCKIQIMNSFNYANQKGGAKLMHELQEACGLKQM